jgi:hypothetical protein
VWEHPLIPWTLAHCCTFLSKKWVPWSEAMLWEWWQCLRHTVSSGMIVLLGALWAELTNSYPTFTSVPERVTLCPLHYGSGPMLPTCHQVFGCFLWEIVSCWRLTVGFGCWQTHLVAEPVGSSLAKRKSFILSTCPVFFPATMSTVLMRLLKSTGVTKKWRSGLYIVKHVLLSRSLFRALSAVDAC